MSPDANAVRTLDVVQKALLITVKYHKKTGLAFLLSLFCLLWGYRSNLDIGEADTYLLAFVLDRVLECGAADNSLAVNNRAGCDR